MRLRPGWFVTGAIVGAGLLVLGQQLVNQHDPHERVRPALDIPGIAPETTAAHSERGDLFAVLAISGDFARRRALYNLAARSDGDRLRALIDDAAQVSDRSDRETTLAIFFRRYGEIDPQAALAIANSVPYAKIDRYRDTVWQTWARNNLDDALRAVDKLQDRADKLAAVQSVYAAHDYMGNERTDRIFSQTGIEQSRQTRLRYLRVLLRDSPVHVVNFINTEPSRLRRDEYINWFGYALDVSDPDAAYSYVESFNSPGDRALYKSTIDGRFSRLNPVDTVWRALAQGETGPNSNFHSAMTELAAQDVDAAIEIYGKIESSNAKVLAAYVIAGELANTNPRRALTWLRSLEDIRTDQIEESLLATIAVSDPGFALETVLAFPATRRESAISKMLLSVAMSSPEDAANLVALIPDDVEMSQSLRMLGGLWLNKNPSAAIGWLESLESGQAADIAAFSVRTAMKTQPDTAIRLLSFLDEKEAASSARFIVSELAATGDVNWALSVAEKLRARDIEGLEPSLAEGLANHDRDRAVQFVQQLPEQATRDAAAARVAGVVVKSDAPDSASVLRTLINGIQDAEIRSTTSRTVMVRMMRADQERASQLLQHLRIPEEEKDVYRQVLRNQADQS